MGSSVSNSQMDLPVCGLIAYSVPSVLPCFRRCTYWAVRARIAYCALSSSGVIGRRPCATSPDSSIGIDSGLIGVAQPASDSSAQRAVVTAMERDRGIGRLRSVRIPPS